MGALRVTGRAGEGLHRGPGLGVSTVWCKRRTFRKVVWRELRLHFGEKQEVGLGGNAGLQSSDKGKGGKDRGERTAAL